MIKTYEKGARFERELVNAARKDGLIAFRSASSKSIIDVTIINPKTKEVRFIQAKDHKKGSGLSKQQINTLGNLSDEYMVRFELMNRTKKQKKKKSKEESRIPFRY